MPELTDIANDFIREEIDEFVERPDERERLIGLFARAPSPSCRTIAAALIDGDDDTVDRADAGRRSTTGRPALEVMDDGLIAGMAIVGIKFRENFIFVPEVLACARAMKAGMAHIEPILSDVRHRAARQGRDGHGQGRPARHRQEPLHHDAARRRASRSIDLGVDTSRRRLHRGRRGARARRAGHVGAADDDDAEHGQDDRGLHRRRPARRREDHGRRRARDAGVRRRHGRRRLRQGRDGLRRARQAADRSRASRV